MDWQTVPIFVDSMKNESTFKMTRCNYFCVTADDPSGGWTFRFGEALRIPFFMLGLQGIIISPFEGNLFTSPQSIEALFETVEKKTRFSIEDQESALFIDVDDIWVPNWVLGGQDGFQVGSAFRIPAQLFAKLHRFRHGLLSEAAMINSSEELMNECQPSVEETKAFQSWWSVTVNNAIVNYGEFGQSALRPKDDRNDRGDRS